MLLNEFDLSDENFINMDWQSRIEEKVLNPTAEAQVFMQRIQYALLETALEDIIVARKGYSKLTTNTEYSLIALHAIIKSTLKRKEFEIYIDFLSLTNLTKLLMGKCYYIENGVQHEVTLRPDELYIDYIPLLNYINADFDTCFNSFSSMSKTNIKVLKLISPSEYAVSGVDLSALKLVNEFQIKTLQFFLESELKKSILEITYNDGTEKTVLVTDDWSVLGSSSYSIKTWPHDKRIGHILAASLVSGSDELNIIDIPILAITKVRKMLLVESCI